MSAFVIALASCAGSVAGQIAKAPAATTKRHSIADQIVRSVLERARIRPPVVRTGKPVGEGTGKIGMVVRLADGSLECVSVLRRGQKLPPPKPLAAPEEIEEIEEEVPEPKKQEPKKQQPKKHVPPRPVPAETPPALPEQPEAAEVDPAKAAGKPAPKAVARRAEPAMIRLVRRDRELRIGGGKVPSRTYGRVDETLDFKELGRHMAGLRAGTPVPTTAVLSIPPEFRLRDWLPVVAEARAAGFERVLLSGGQPNAVPEASARVIDQVIDSMDWEPTGKAVGPVPDLYGQELLILLDGDEAWSDVLGIYMRCLRQGMWRLAFVAVDAEGQRFKVPLPVPVDGG